jgi:RimJ/RimL family protein N-acetyltransferase
LTELTFQVAIRTALRYRQRRDQPLGSIQSIPARGMNGRLRLREFRESDLDALAAMVGDPEQMTFYPQAKTGAEASAWIRRNRSRYQEHGFGFWLIELLPRSRFAGYFGIRPLELDGVSEIEMGWHVHKRFWRQGVATQAATSARDAAVRRFAISRLVALVHPEHVASRRVAERIGMREERTTLLEDDYPAVVHAMKAADGPARPHPPRAREVI